MMSHLSPRVDNNDANAVSTVTLESIDLLKKFSRAKLVMQSRHVSTVLSPMGEEMLLPVLH